MNLNEAFRKSVKAYFKGKAPDSLKGANKKHKYNKAYFDRIEKEHFGSLEDGEEDKK